MTERYNACKRLRNFIIYLGAVLVMAGCGKEALPEVSPHPQTRATEWKSKGFALSGGIMEEQGLWAAEYLEWAHPEMKINQENEYLYVQEAGTWDGKVYRFLQKKILTGDAGEDGEKNQYYLEIYDTVAKTAQLKEVDMAGLGLAGAFLRGAQVMGPESFALQVWNGECRLIYTDLAQVQAEVAIGEVYERHEIAEDICAFECIVDAGDNLYARAGSAWQPFRDLYIFDRDGNLLMKHGGKEDDEVKEPLRMPSGELVFPIYNVAERSTEFVWFDLEEKKEVKSARLDKEILKQVYGISGNDMYYESAKGIVQWNIATGERQLVYDFTENGVSGKHQTEMIFPEGQPPVLRAYGTVEGEQEDWLYVMSRTKVEKADAIEVVALTSNGQKVQACTATASRKNPQFAYTYQDESRENAEDFRTRIMAEMVSGDGPDILYVSLEDMELLQEKGLLVDLEQVLTKESLEQILPGVVQLGTVEGTFVGLAPEMDILTMVTLKDIWQQDTWSMQDLIGLMESGEFTGLFCQGNGVFAPQAVLKFLVDFGLQEGKLIDWEKGESLFDSEAFLQILDMMKKYGADPLTAHTYLGKGGCPAMFTGGGVHILNELYEQYGDTYYVVGYPTIGNSGNYLTGAGVVVVNQNTAHSEAVAAFLECLLKDEIQYASSVLLSLPVTKVSPEEVKIVEIDGELRASWRGQEIRIKEDGSTTLEDYIALLESCVPYPGTYETIESIVWEEAAAYLSGDKSAAEVARIVDSRVQLYLDERE